MNLVYLSKKPVITNSTQKEFVPAATHTNGAGIAMRVHTFTEVRIKEDDDYTVPPPAPGRGQTNGGDNRLSRAVGGGVTFDMQPSQGHYASAFDGGFNAYGAQKERSVAFTPYKASRIDTDMLHTREGDRKSTSGSEQSLTSPTKTPV